MRQVVGGICRLLRRDNRSNDQGESHQAIPHVSPEAIQIF
jgi:hypothetical protein